MKHLGDITKIDGGSIEPVNVISFGSPCQDLSVAGKRAGLDGERSGLFMEAVRIIKEMREHDRETGRTDVNVRPRFGIWENVPGAFSSNKGEDFRVVLEELARVTEADYNVPSAKKWEHNGCIYGENFSIAWRLFDAQYSGVPQRRKRLCVLCDFNGHTAPELLFIESVRMAGDTGGEPLVLGSTTGCTGQVQFERESVSGYFEPSIEAWKGIAKDPERSF